MKKYNQPLNAILLIVTLFMVACTAQKTAVSSTENYGEIIGQQQYTFQAQNVTPTEDSRYNPRLMFPNGSNLYNLSYGYNVRVTRDSVIAYLPFFGRAYTAPLDPSKGGIEFTSTNFDYKQTMRKKNYQITINPKDVRDIRSVNITISPDGYAYLQVLSQNRTPISYNGIIESNK